MIVFQRDKKNVFAFIIVLFLYIFMALIAYSGARKFPSQKLIYTFIVIMGGSFTIVMLVVGRKEYKYGTFTLLRFKPLGFDIYKAFSKKRTVMWDDIESIQYNSEYEVDKIYIEVVYFIDRRRVKEIINIFYKNDIDKYFLKHCKEKFLNSISTPFAGKQSMSDII